MIKENYPPAGKVKFRIRKNKILLQDSSCEAFFFFFKHTNEAMELFHANNVVPVVKCKLRALNKGLK